MRELTNLVTSDSETYLLSNGDYRTIIHQPVRFKDAQGAWQAINTSLVAGSLPGTYQSAATPFAVTLGNAGQASSPAVLSAYGFSLGFDLVGLNQSGLIALGDTATYPAAAASVAASYQVLGRGLEQTITLTSASAASAYTCRISHPGLNLRQNSTGAWGFYRPGGLTPLFMLSTITVYDSSQTNGGAPAVCDAATMAVTAGTDQSTLTYSVPQSWLSDPTRIYPVKIDPEIVLYPYANDPNPPGDCDTFIKSAQPDQSDAPGTSMMTGHSSTYGFTRSLINFDLQPLYNAAGGHPFVEAATFSVYKWDGGGSAPSVSIGVAKHQWDCYATWNNPQATVNSFSSYLDYICSRSGVGNGWLSPVDVRSYVQQWVNGTLADAGFVLYQAESGGQATDAYRSYWRSVDYNNGQYAPKLTIDWAMPQASTTLNTSVYRVGDTVTVSATISSASYLSYVREVQFLVNDGATNPYRGTFGWFTYNPGSKWTSRQINSTSYVAFEAPPGTAAGTQYLTPDLTNSNAAVGSTITLTFKYSINSNYGQVQANNVYALIGMDVAAQSPRSGATIPGVQGSEAWSSGWVQQSGASFSVAPPPVISLASTMSSSGWFTETDANGDGLPDNKDDVNGQGRGVANLSWPASPCAFGYHIYLYDGSQYRQVGSTTTQTTWSSSGKGIYPTDSEIANPNYTGPFHTDGTGLDLRDNPNAFYQKVAPTGNFKNATQYRFCVVPYGPAGDTSAPTAAENPKADVALDNRTQHVREAPQHTSCQLGNFAGQVAQADLDVGRLAVAATDLSIDSWGPTAALDRTYWSSRTSAGYFAPGWRFSFERSLTFVNSNITNYTDEDGETYVFAKSGSTWLSPNGLVATLVPSGSNWTLTFKDKSVLTFDSSGRLLSEADANGNPATYSWSGGNMTTITAANGQAIALTYSAGKLTSASYTTADGTRTVNYDSTAGTVTYFPNQSASLQETVEYDYSSGLLSDLTVLNWPQNGQNAHEHFAYDGSNRIHVMDLPSYFENDTYHPDHSNAVTTIDYGTSGASSATMTTQSRVNDTNTPVTETFSWSPVATTVTSVGPKTASETPDSNYTQTYEYSPDNQVLRIWAPDGSVSSCVYDTRGNVVTQTDPKGNQTTYIYDANDRPMTVQDPGGSTTTLSYDSRGNLLSELATVDATHSSCSQYVYADVQPWQGAPTFYGALTEKKDLISGTPSSGTWRTTDYNTADISSITYYPNGEPHKTTSRAVQLYDPNFAPPNPPTSPVDLTATNTYDAFGNLLTKADFAGNVTETDTYDLAGRSLTATDACGTVDHHTYDCLGNEVESWTSAASSPVKEDWMQNQYDADGQLVQTTSILVDSSGTQTGQVVDTHTYDASEADITSHNSVRGGADAKTIYDARGNPVKTWASGCVDQSDARAAVCTYDPLGHTTTFVAPGTSSAAQETYDSCGQTTSQTNADGSSTTYVYDSDGNRVSEVTTASDGSQATITNGYDLGGRLTSTTASDGTSTQYWYDLLGHVTAARWSEASGAMRPQSTTAYNSLGWVLSRTDADGITIARCYDAIGRLASQAVGKPSHFQTTSYSYDANSRLVHQVNADGSILDIGYDCFGRKVDEKHTVGAVVVKDVGTSYDSLDRELTVQNKPSSQQPAIWTRTTQYPVDASTDKVTTLAFDGLSTTMHNNPRGYEYSDNVTGTGVSVSRTVDSRDAGEQVTQTTIGGVVSWLRRYDSGGRLCKQWGTGWTNGPSVAEAQVPTTYAYNTYSGLKSSDNLLLNLGGTSAPSYHYLSTDQLADANAPSGGNPTTNTFATPTTVSGHSLVKETMGQTNVAQYSFDQSTLQLASSTDASGQTNYGYDANSGSRAWQQPPSAQQHITYSYTGLNLTGFSNPNTSPAVSATYSYDASGERTQSVVTSGTSVTTTNFNYNDGISLLGLSAQSPSDSWKIDYLYDGGGHPYAGLYYEPATTTTPVQFEMVTTDRGDVVELVDANGNPFVSYRYDAWGKPAGTQTASTSLISSQTAGQVASRQVLRYAGYCYDSETGFYYLLGRYYDPSTRQFISKDPAGLDGEGSAYQYCSGDPVNCTDVAGDAPTRVNFHFPTAFSNCTDYFRKVLRDDAGYVHTTMNGSKWHNPFTDLRDAKRFRNWVKKWGPWDLKQACPSGSRTVSQYLFETPVQYQVRTWQYNGWTFYNNFGGDYWISADDFGNLHYGYVPRGALWLARKEDTAAAIAYYFHEAHDPVNLQFLLFMSKKVAEKDFGGTLDYNNAAIEAQGEAMIVWGWELEPLKHWCRAWSSKPVFFVRWNYAKKLP